MQAMFTQVIQPSKWQLLIIKEREIYIKYDKYSDNKKVLSDRAELQSVIGV